MTIRFQLLLLVLLITIFFLIVNMVRKEKLELKYSLTWILSILVLALIIIQDKLIYKFSLWAGIVTPVNFIFFTGFVFSLGITFSLTVAQSRNSNRIKRLSQEIALLCKQVEDMKKNK